MAAPKWKTPKGNLGTIQEQEYYELVLQAIVPDDSNPSLKFKIIAGELPPGLVLNEQTGTINGRSKDQYRLYGVPYNVAQDVTSTFCCRVTNTKTGQVSDRTFSLTITGQDAPTIVSNVEQLGQILDGTYAEYQITAIDLDVEPLTYYITNGELPSGMSLDPNTGIISGIVNPVNFLDVDATVGWSSEGAGWDQFPWEFYSRNASKNYVFDVNVTDGKDIVSKKFGIYVISKDSLTADNDVINVNGFYDLITADLDQKRTPVVTSTETDIGIYTHDNYFAYQFKAIDFDGDVVAYSILLASNVGFDNEFNGFDSVLFDSGDLELPQNLTLSSETGWLFGYLAAMPGIQKEYKFGIYAYKRDYPEYKSPIRTYSMTVVGDLQYYIDWLSPSDLGTVIAGNPSELAIEAVTTFDKPIIYSLKVGSNSRLPQGLRLLENGLISGRPSFEVTSYDNSTLTFDKNIRIGNSLLPETTFDREYTFTVKATDIDNTLVAYKTFKVKVLSVYTRPYESLYLRAQPGLADKELYNQVVYNTDIIPSEYVYRLGDPYYGKQTNLEVLVLSGINPSEPHEYIEAMVINHYRKKLLIGEPTIARALDDNGDVKYEVLYLPMKDDNGSVSKSVDLIQKIKRHITTDRLDPRIDLTYFTIDGYDKIVYPNALRSMRQQIRDTLGYVDREVLPSWMTSKQEDGHIPYWTPAMVLAYLKPGTGAKVKFLLDRFFKYDLKDLSFEVDRYVWDCNLSAVYDATKDKYFDSHQTTFDTQIQLAAEPLIFNFVGNGTSTTFDLTSPQSDFDADVGNDATVTLSATYYTALTNIGYTLTGIDEDALGEVTFTDVDNNYIVVQNLTNGSYTINLPGFVDGLMTATLTVRDTSNNTAIGTGDAALIDTTADVLGDASVNITDAIVVDNVAVAYVISGVDLDATATVTFTDTANTHVVLTGLTNGSHTANLSTLIDGIITASITVADIHGNTATGTGDSALLETVKCMICSSTLATEDPLTFTPDQSGIVLDTNFSGSESFSCIDWETKEFHQFWYSTDNKLWLITFDLDTRQELRRTSTADMSTILDRATGTELIYTIEPNSIFKCPGTDWIVFNFNSYDSRLELLYPNQYNYYNFPSTYLTMNTVTGEVNTYLPPDYPLTNTISGYTATATIGLLHSQVIWAKPLGTNSGKTLVCGSITSDGYTAYIQRMGLSLFIVDNTTGAISCIAYGDAGPLKSYINQYHYGDISVATTIGNNYTEFVFHVFNPYPGVDESHWADETWVRNNITYDAFVDYKMNAYKVRITTDGTITYDPLVNIEPDFISTVSSRPMGYFTTIVDQLQVRIYSKTDDKLILLCPVELVSWVKMSDGSYYQSNLYANTGKTAVYKINLSTGSYTRTVVDANVDYTYAWYGSNAVINWFEKNNSAELKVLVGKSSVQEYYANTIDDEIYILDCETLAIERWLDKTAAAYNNIYMSSVNALFIDIPNCRFIGASGVSQFTVAPKKETNVQYIAVKVKFPTNGLPENAIVNSALPGDPCTGPTTDVESYYPVLIVDKTTDSATVNIEIDSNEIYLFDENSSTWIKDNTNQVIYNTSITPISLDYSGTSKYYVPTITFTDYGYETDFTVPGTSYKFTNAVPSVIVPAFSAATNWSYCAIDFDVPTAYKRLAESYYDHTDSYLLDNTAGSSLPLDITLNGVRATVIGSLAEPNDSWKNAMNLDEERNVVIYRETTYAWVLLKTEVTTTKNAACASPEPQAEPVLETYPNNNLPRYAVLTMFGDNGETVDSLVRHISADIQPLTNYVGKYSADFGNTYGNGMYLNGILIGRWAGDSVNNIEQVYFDLDAMRIADPYNAGGYSEEWFEVRMNFSTPTTNMYGRIDMRVYSGGELDPVTLQPTVEGEMASMTVVWAPIFSNSTTSTLGDFACKISFNLDYYYYNWWRAFLQGHAVQISNSYLSVSTASEACAGEPVIGSLPSNGVTNYATEIYSIQVDISTSGGYFYYDSGYPNYQTGWQSPYGDYIYSTDPNWSSILYRNNVAIPGPWKWAVVGSASWYDGIWWSGIKSSVPSGNVLPQTNLPPRMPSSNYYNTTPITWYDWNTSGLKGEFWALPIDQTFNCYLGNKEATYGSLAKVTDMTLDFSELIPNDGLYLYGYYYGGRHTLHQAKPIAIGYTYEDQSVTLAGNTFTYPYNVWALLRMGPNESNF